MPQKDKYVPIGAHLRPMAAEHSDVTLTYAEIERIIGMRLPRGAQSAAFWQGVNGKPPPRARAWLAAGFIAQPDPAHSRVRFHRVAVAALKPGHAAVGRTPAVQTGRPGDRR